MRGEDETTRERRTVMEPRGSECRCGGCGETFTGLGLFDKHRQGDWDARYCVAPATLGLAQDARGTWGTPEGLKARERYATRMRRARSERTP